MNCEDLRRVLAEEPEEEPTEQQRREIEAHILLCPDCRAYRAALRRVDALLAETPMLSPPPDFAERVSARLAGRRSRRRTWSGLGVLTLAGASGMGALLYILVGGALSIWSAANTPQLWSLSIQLLRQMASSFGTLFKMGWLLVESLALLVQQPQAVVAAVVIFALTLLWTQVVTRLPTYARSA
jgi:predicted anti-sigma-YlaC factor YlaD